MNERPGQVIAGRYRLDRVLGTGGFGTTWAGVDETTERPVAIKALDMRRVDDWKAQS